MRISDWSSDVCSSDLGDGGVLVDGVRVDEDGFRDHSASRQVTGQAVLTGGFGDGGRYSVLLNTPDLRADDPQGLTAAQLRVARPAATAGPLNSDPPTPVHKDQVGVPLDPPPPAGHTPEPRHYG